MPKKRKDYKDIELPLAEWNATTFKAYIAHLNQKRFGIPCVHGFPASENKQINDMCKEYGKEVVLDFIAHCVMKYKPSAQYPTVNWTFMFKYQKQHILPSLLKALHPKVEAPLIDEEELKSLF